MEIVTLLTIGEWGNLSTQSRHRINVYGLEHDKMLERLQLARELIAALTNNGQLSPRLMTPETRGLWERWQAEEQTP